MTPKIKQRVLCVEDDPDTREMLGMLFRSLEITAQLVSTAEECLSVSRRERFDLYLLDAWLPDGDGVELCRSLRNLNPDGCLVFYSGAAFETDRQRALEAGADDYIVKPEIDQLIKTLLELTTPGGLAKVRKTCWPKTKQCGFVGRPSFMVIA